MSEPFDPQKHLCLPLSLWPKEWQALWHITFIDKNGDFAHHRQSYIYNLYLALGSFLNFVRSQSAEFKEDDVQASVALYRCFVKFLAQRGNTERSILDNMRNLHKGLEKMTGSQIRPLFQFCRRLGKKVSYEKAHSLEISKKERVFKPLEEIFAVGSRLFSQAQSEISGKSGEDFEAAMMTARKLARDGLLIMLFCHCPLRKADMVRLDIDEHFVRFENHWELQIKAEKNRAQLVFPLPDELRAELEAYIEIFRPHFPNSDKHRRLWSRLYFPKGQGRVADRRDNPEWCEEGTALYLGKSSIYSIFKQRTGECFDEGLYPHFVRSAVVEFWEREFPEEMVAVASVLGHSGYDITEIFYRIRFKSSERQRLSLYRLNP